MSETNGKVVCMVTGGSGLYGMAIRAHVAQSAEEKDATWVFLSSKDGDLRDRKATEAIFERVPAPYSLIGVFAGACVPVHDAILPTYGNTHTSTTKFRTLSPEWYPPERFEFVEVIDATPPGVRILDNDGSGRHHRRGADVRAGLPVGFVNSCVDRADLHPATS